MSTRTYRPGTVVVYDGYPSGPILAVVNKGPNDDGTYDVAEHGRVDPKHCRPITGGLEVEYYSTSQEQWIPAQVLRKGSAPATFDLDCKEGVAISRMRLPIVERNAQLATTVHDSGNGLDKGAENVSGATGSSSVSRAARAPCIGEYCFYSSSKAGWLAAKVLNVHAEAGTFELTVKPRASLASIRCVWEGDVVEYNSASLGWIPARVLRVGRGEGTFDLDCKESVALERIRPASEETAAKYSAHQELSEAIRRGDAEGLREALRRASSVGLPQEEMTRAEKALAGLDSSCSSPENVRDELLRARRGGDATALRNALNAARNAGVQTDEVMPAEWALKALEARENLQAALDAQNVQVLRGALQQAADAGVEGEELDHAAHVLWSMETRPSAELELRKATATLSAALANAHNDCVGQSNDAVLSAVGGLRAALEAAEAVGVHQSLLDAAAQDLRNAQPGRAGGVQPKSYLYMYGAPGQMEEPNTYPELHPPTQGSEAPCTDPDLHPPTPRGEARPPSVWRSKSNLPQPPAPRHSGISTEYRTPKHSDSKLSMVSTQRAAGMSPSKSYGSASSSGVESSVPGLMTQFVGAAESFWSWAIGLGPASCTRGVVAQCCDDGETVPRSGNTVHISNMPPGMQEGCRI